MSDEDQITKELHDLSFSLADRVNSYRSGWVRHFRRRDAVIAAELSEELRRVIMTAKRMRNLLNEWGEEESP